MKFVLLLSFLLVWAMTLSVEIDHSIEDEKEWDSFKVKYGRHYKTNEEEKYRKSVFLERLNTIRKVNDKYRRGEFPFYGVIDKFSDLTLQEYADQIILNNKQYNQSNWYPRDQNTNNFSSPSTR